MTAVIGRIRSASPWCAFLAAAALTVLLAAQAQLACTHAMVMPMPGMDMSAAGTPNAFALCPIVLILGLAAAFLALNAVALFARDPHRRTNGTVLVRRYARLPLHGVAAVILALGSGAVGLLMAVDGNAPAALSGWLVLGAIVMAVTLATAIAGLGTVRVVAALTRRLAAAIAGEATLLRRGALVPVYVRHANATRPLRRVPVLAAARGLRAPPITVR